MQTAKRNQITVLHVDDQVDFADLAAEFIERENEQIRVETITSGQAALDHLATNSVDCVVSDYDMPGMDGIEFLETVRDKYPDLPFILFTGKGSEDVASEAIQAGVTDYLQKRRDSSQYKLLVNRIENAVEQQRAQEAAINTQQRFQTIANHANDIFWIFDGDFDELLFVNDAYEDIWGQAITAINQQPRSLLDAVHPEDRARVTAAIDRLIEGESVNLEFRVNPDEEYGRWVWVKGTPTGDETDKASTIVGFGREITERKKRTQELERMTDLFEQAQEIANFGAWETDLRDNDGWWTEQVNQIYGLPTGYEPEPGEGIEYFHPEDRSVIRDAFERARATGESYDLELRVGDREEFTWVRACGKPQTEDGEVVRVRGTLQDITDSKEHEQELERSHTLLSTLFETLPQGVLAENDSRNVLATNERLFELFDLPGSPEEVIGADCEQMASTVGETFAEPETFVTRIDSVISDGEPVDSEELELADGRIFERSYRPIELRNGDGHLWVYNDITERKEQQRELETILERMNDAVFVYGPEGSFLFVNQTAVERYGYDESDLYEMTPENLTVADEGANVSDRVNRVLTDGELVFETKHRLASGESFPVEINATKVTFRGKPAVLSIARDITERKQQERQLRRQNERLDEFATVVSHDLRNPLNTAQGRIELAEQDCDSDHLSKAENSIDRSLALIDDMLTLARAGEQTSDVEPVDVADLALTSWEQVETGEASIDAQTSTRVRADRSRLRQLLENLFRNAVEHGGDTVTVTVGDLPTGFFVADDGGGIPEEKREDVFESGYSTAEEGTGFGLSIVREIAEAHDWRIRVTESSNGGARFEITGISGVTE